MMEILTQSCNLPWIGIIAIALMIFWGAFIAGSAGSYDRGFQEGCELLLGRTANAKNDLKDINENS